MLLQLPTRWIAVLFFLFAATTWIACNKEYSLENNKQTIDDIIPPDDDSTDNGNDDDSTGNDDDDDGGDDTTDNGDDDDSPAVSDLDFLKTATYINHSQVTNATLAIDRGTAQAVRDYGQALQTRFKAAHSDMQTLADQLQATIPDQTDETHQAVTDGFLDMEGKTFDIAYIDYQLSELQKAIDMYRGVISNTTNAGVKAYAQKYLPYLEGFLSTASAIRQTL
jgi:putative membrane protein